MPQLRLGLFHCSGLLLAICLAVPADLDEGGDVDLDDFSIFAGCITGPGIAYPGGCEHAAVDGDLGVDSGHYGRFQGAFSGPGT